MQLKAELEDSITKKTNDDDGDDDDFDDLADFDDLDDLGESIVHRIVGCDCVFFVLTNVIVQMMTTMMTTLNWRHRLRENWLMRSNLRIHNSSFLHVTSLSRRDVLCLCSVITVITTLILSHELNPDKKKVACVYNSYSPRTMYTKYKFLNINLPKKPHPRWSASTLQYSPLTLPDMPSR